MPIKREYTKVNKPGEMKFVTIVTEEATLVFGDKLEATMAELSESEAASDASPERLLS